MDAAIALRERRLDLAGPIVGDFRVGAFAIGAGLKAHHLALRAQWSLLSANAEAASEIRVAIDHAESQGADFWLEIDRLLLGLAEGQSALNREVRRLSDGGSVYFGALAEHFVERLADLEADEFDCVRLEMERRPERWLTALRDALTNGSESAVRAAQCLDVIGSAEDVPLLRRFSKRRPSERDLGKGLARRVAEHVFVEDQGRVAIAIGARRVEGTQIRRKVLTLLCFLLSRPRFSSTRDEVLEALWPEFEPGVALNSLNQTVYFLRRVFEPSYREDTSPGFVRHESDLVWLDRQLVRSRTQICADFVRSLEPNPSPEEVQHLLSMYRGQFALDFAYEEWAVQHRETLHASYLQVVERSVASDMATGHWERGIVTARLALSVDHEAEHIEASLVRLLRLSGAHAAAAEQYEHYSSALREALGIDPPPLDAL